MQPIFTLILRLLPAFVGNMAPIWYGGGKDAIDGGKKWSDGRSVFGKGKTWRGFFSALVVATLTAFLTFGVLHEYDLTTQLIIGLLLGLGAMVGDLAGSFLKRRLNVPSGQPYYTDQLGFMIVAIAFAWPYLFLAWDDVLVLLVITYVLHVVTNQIAFRAKFKSVPW